MIVRKLNQIIQTSRDVDWGNGNSRRFLVRDDNMNFTLTDTIINQGTTSLLEYTNHLEACYCIEGSGEVISLSDGERHLLEPGTMYALDQHDRHYLTALTQLRLICVFSPALNGTESHSLSSMKTSSY